MPISCYIYHNFLRLTYFKYYFKFKYKKNVLSCYGCFYTSADIADIYLHLSADTDNRLSADIADISVSVSVDH